MEHSTQPRYCSAADLTALFGKSKATIRRLADMHQWRYIEEQMKRRLYDMADVERTLTTVTERQRDLDARRQPRRPASPGEEDRLARRFWSRVDRAGGCWIWKGARVSNGYGQMRWLGKPTVAHRIAYELAIGPIPDGFQIDHMCVLPECVRPDHLQIVTRAENLRLARLRRRVGLDS